MNRVLAALHMDAVPNPAAVAPPGLGDKILLLLGAIKWGAMVGGVAALIVAGVMLGFQRRRGEASEGAVHILQALIGVGVAATAAALVGWIWG
jgi:hypothetical protein